MDKYTEEKLHSAMHVIAGYEYQFKYFFWKVVSLSVDDKEVSMELHDDVAVVGKEHIKIPAGNIRAIFRLFTGGMYETPILLCRIVIHYLLFFVAGFEIPDLF